MGKIRLDKYLADMGLGTRSQVKQQIRKGSVTVNGEIVKTPDYKIDIEEDRVAAGGKCLAYETFSYYMLYKPQAWCLPQRISGTKPCWICLSPKNGRICFR